MKSSHRGFLITAIVGERWARRRERARRRVGAGGVGLVALLAVLAFPGSSWAGGPGTWTKIATLDSGGDTAGMLRTADGKLHLVWLNRPASNGTHSYGTSTISLAGKLLATGTALSGWSSLEPDPQLVRDGSGLRLIFEGSKGSSGCYVDASVFTATSADGTTWNLVNGSLDAHTAGVGNVAATVESDGTTPVSTFAGGGLFHIGVDSSCPASTLDGTVPVASGNSPSNPAIVTAQDGSVWVATFQAFAKTGYFVAKILPTVGPLLEAPASAATAAHNNQPLEPVALAARAGGGVYMAYCVANSSQPCAHIDLWNIGSSKARVVPGSNSTSSARVALTAEPGGRLAVVWYNAAKNVLHAVRTNTSATSFGAVRTIKPPAHTTGFYDIQSQGSSGRLDVVINAQIQTGTSYPAELLQTQILPGLSLKASPAKFSHKKAATVTFTVTDAGQPVPGSKVSCLGKHGQTTTSGHVKLHFSKGAATGRHVCAATKSGYNGGKTTLRVK